MRNYFQDSNNDTGMAITSKNQKSQKLDHYTTYHDYTAVGTPTGEDSSAQRSL